MHIDDGLRNKYSSIRHRQHAGCSVQTHSALKGTSVHAAVAVWWLSSDGRHLSTEQQPACLLLWIWSAATCICTIRTASKRAHRTVAKGRLQFIFTRQMYEYEASTVHGAGEVASGLSHSGAAQGQAKGE